MKPTVCTKGFQWVHGHAPRGSGAWAFHFGPAKDSEPVFGPWFDSFKKARAWAEREAVKRGATEVKVAP
jgi:hypothetical protein